MNNKSIENDIRIDDLPTWMRLALQPYDYGFLLVGTVAVLIGWFFLVGPQLPNGLDITRYAFLVEDYAQSLREGQLYPRWAAHANSGYGSPIPHFMPPFVPYTMASVSLFSGQNTTSVLRFYLLLMFVLAGIGTYGYVREAFHAKAAFLASVLFLTSPIFGHELLHVIGEVSILTAMTEFIFFQWVLLRWLRFNGGRIVEQNLLFLLMGGMILTHPPSALLAIIYGYVVCGGYGWWGHTLGQVWGRFTLLVGISLGISAFYWLPALVDIHAIQFTQFHAITPSWHTTFRTLIEPHYPLSSSIQIPPIRLSVGVLRSVLMLIGWGWVYRRQGFGLPHYLISLLMTFTLFLNLTIFHQSLILPTLITWYACIMGGWVMDKLPTEGNAHTRILLVGLCTLTLAVSRASWLPPDPQTHSAQTYSPLGQLQYELNGRGVAVLPSLYPYPSLPSPTNGNNTYWLSYTRHTPDRLSSSHASLLVTKNHESVWQITNSIETRIQVFQSGFNGWKATLNETPLSITTNAESGLIQVVVPSSINGRLQVKMGNTVIRGITSLLSGGVLLISLIRHNRNASSSNARYNMSDGIGLLEARLIGGMLVWFALLLLVSASPNARWSLRPSQIIPLNPYSNIQARTQAGIALVGYSLAETRFSPNEVLSLTLLWATLRPLETNYLVEVTLLNEQGETLKFEQPLRYPGSVATRAWQVNRFVYDHHTLQLPLDVPNGSYQLALQLRHCHYAKQKCTVTTTPSPLFFANFGQPIGERVILPNLIEVAKVK